MSEPRPIKDFAEGLFEGITNAILRFAEKKMFHWPWTIRKWEKEGLYPAFMTVQLIKVPIVTKHSMIVRFQINVTPRVRCHLVKFAIRKEGKSSTIQEWMFNGNDNVFPQILFDEGTLLIRENEPPYFHSSITIDKTLDSLYYCPEATFEIPYIPEEKKIRIQVLIETHDMKGKSYELCSEWMEL